MKGVILAGGTGSRLRPLTDYTPKQLIPVANIPVLERAVESMVDVGINEIGVVLGNKGRDEIRMTLGDGDRLGASIEYIVQGNPSGLADAVSHAKDFVGQESFMVYFGDTILHEEILRNLRSGFQPETHDVGIVFQEVGQPSRYGIGNFDDNVLVGVEEKPDEPPSNLAYVGAVALSPTAFDVISEQEPSDRGELELTDTIDELVRAEGTPYWDVVPGLWKDVGTPTDVIETNRILLEHELKPQQNSSQRTKAVDGVDIGENCSIDDSVTLRDPVSIGDNVVISGESTIGPGVSIAEDCTLTDVHLESSVLLENVSVAAVSLEQSLIGEGATISGDEHNTLLSVTISRNAEIIL